MAATVLSNPKRVMNMLWIAAGIMFTVAVIHSLSGGESAEWVSSRVQGIVGDKSRMSLREHMRLAEASWAKTVRQRHDLIRADWGTVDKMELWPSFDGVSYFVHPYTIWDFTPASYGCPHEMERIGRMGDGGKWVCGMSKYIELSKKQKCVVYSFGVRDESSFEEELLERTNCEIWAYDFSVVDFGAQIQPQFKSRAHFLQVGISGKTDKTREPPFYSIKDLMAMNGHDYIDILKMDIEFAEFEAMDGLNRDFPAEQGLEFPIGQFMVEAHFFNGLDAKTYLQWWERLESRGMRPTWTEPNLVAVTVNADGNKNPIMAEYTLINTRDRRSVVFGDAATY